MPQITKYLKTLFEPELLHELSLLESVEISANSTLLKPGNYIKVIPIVINGRIKVIKKDKPERKYCFIILTQTKVAYFQSLRQ